MKVLRKDISLADVARAIEDTLIDLGFNAHVEQKDHHSFNVRVATEDKSDVILICGAVGLGGGC